MENKKLAPVYCSWGTMQNALNQLAKATPTHLDRSAFTGIAWTVQTQLLTGFKFLGLTDETGKTKPELIALAEDTANRKVNWERLLRDRYRFVFEKVDLSTATPKQLQEAMAASGINGDTQDRAIRFFLSAAEFTGIKLSPFLMKGRKPSAATPRKRTRTRKPVPTADEQSGPNTTPGPGITVQLRSGGSLTVSATVDVFSMSSDDRAFVFKIIDDLRAYEAREQ